MVFTVFMANILVTDTDRFREIQKKKTRNISEIEWLDFDGSQKEILKYTKNDFRHEN